MTNMRIGKSNQSLCKGAMTLITMDIMACAILSLRGPTTSQFANPQAPISDVTNTRNQGRSMRFSLIPFPADNGETKEI
jgi:hypothetical protein